MDETEELFEPGSYYDTAGLAPTRANMGGDLKLSQALPGLGRPVAYYPELARFLGNVDAAILLAQLVYWKGRTAHDYLYTTDSALEDETGLTTRELRRARKLLSGPGIITAQLARLQHEMHYLIKLDVLDARWTAWLRDGRKRRPRRGGLKHGSDGRFVSLADRQRNLLTERERSLGKDGKRTSGKDRGRALDPLEFPEISSKTSPDTPYDSPQGESSGPSPAAIPVPLAASSPDGESSAAKEARLEARRRLLAAQARQLQDQEVMKL